jgi:type II secretory pathway pseudopilin PulG
LSNQNRVQNQSGFTILETIIAAGILTIAIIGVNLQYIQQLKAESADTLQLQAAQILDQVKNNVISNPGQFPIVQSSNGTPVVYVGCFKENGAIQGHFGDPPQSPDLSYIGIFPELSGRDLSKSLQDPLSKNPICMQGIGGIEIHISASSSGLTGKSLQIDAVILEHTGRQFKLPATHLQSFIEF